MTERRPRRAARLAAALGLGLIPAPAPATPSLPAPLAAPARGDDGLARAGRTLVAGGVLSIPPAFASEDGVFDLVVHFHGNTDLVEESVAAADLNAVLVVVNLGVGSGVYEARFAPPDAFPDLVSRIEATLRRRGLARARAGRIALSAWSAGYGAVLRILDHPDLAARVDAVILLDGLHVGYTEGDHALAVERLAPIERFARAAAAGRKLLSITHSEIIPGEAYAGVHETTDAILRDVGVPRVPGGLAPVLPALHAMNGVLPKAKLVPLEPLSVAHRGGLVVRGYAGTLPEHHVLQLVEMSSTALPDLVARWAR